MAELMENENRTDDRKMAIKYQKHHFMRYLYCYCYSVHRDYSG